MKKRTVTLFALILCAAMIACVLTGCKEKNNDQHGSDATEPPVALESEAPATAEPTEEPAPQTFEEIYPDKIPAERRTAERIEGTEYDGTLTVGCAALSGQFSPFFAATAYDHDVSALTQVNLCTYDRDGGMIMNGIAGETRAFNGTDYFYNGAADLSVNYDQASDTTKYTVVIRPDMTFSDGEPVTIDDLIFTYYVLLDLGYNGLNDLRSCDIVGLQDYRTQTTSEVYDRLKALTGDILEAGCDYTCTGSESFTQAQHDIYWDKVREGWDLFCSGIVGYISRNYASNGYVHMLVDPEYTADSFLSTEGGRIVFGMAGWGYGECTKDEEGNIIFTTRYTDKSFNISEDEYPTVRDYTEAMMACYENDPISAFNAEMYFGCACDSPEEYAVDPFIAEAGRELMGGNEVKSISGIKRVNDWCCEVTLNGYSATAVYSLFDVAIAPMHYYGDEAKYDYDNGSYGFDRGDLSTVEARTGEPMGAGAYKFVSYEDNKVTLEAYEDYCFSKPMTKNLEIRAMNSSDLINYTAAEKLCAATDIYGTVEVFGSIMSLNSNGELNGNKLYTYRADVNNYGYIGINADTVKVGGDASSEASKNLRRGYATVLALFRKTAVDNYFGASATTIDYPISSVSWAAPRPGDEGYETAFTRDVDGNEIYTEDMTEEERAAAALSAAKGFFEAAGFTFGEDGKVENVPEGAKTDYRAIVYGKGTGSHPNYLALDEAAKLLQEIGFNITIIDTGSPNVLWDALYSGTQEIWTASQEGTVDPDLYDRYHSANISGMGGTDYNYYRIADGELDKLIEKARASADQAERKGLYKQCLDKVMDWACEVPCYQRCSCSVVCPVLVAVESVTPDVTANHPWFSDISMIQVYPAE